MSISKNSNSFIPRPAQRLPAEAYTKEETYRSTRHHVNAAVTLIPDAYTSEEFFAIEQEKVFATSWVPVGCTSQLKEPGDVIVTSVAGQSIIITRDQGGHLQAFYNVCRHRGVKLLDDDCTQVKKRFRCPYHSWAYDFQGNCLGTPLFTGSDIPEDQQGIFDMSDVEKFDKADYGLLPVKVDSWGFLVFVNLDPDTAPLTEQLGDLPQRLDGYRLEEWQVVKEKTYHIKANYKLIGENFMEYYHLPWVHPELIKVSRMEDHYRWQGPGMYTGMCTMPISQNTDEGGWLGLPPVSTLSEENSISARFIWLFPNIAINVLPNHSFIMITHPISAGYTIESTRLLVHPESWDNPGSEEALEELAKFWNLINVQDIEIVERVQEGLSIKAYTGGRMCYHFEEPLHRFQNMVIDRMLGIHRIPPADAVEQVPMFGSTGSNGRD